MKTTTTIVITFVATLVLSVAISTFAVMLPKGDLQSSLDNEEQKLTESLNAETSTTIKTETKEDVSATELRFRAIEERLTKLEQK